MSNIYILNPLMSVVGVLTQDLPKGMTYFNDELTESIQDNLSTLTFEVDATNQLTTILETEGYVIYPKEDGSNQLFVIKEITDTHEGDFDKKVFCENSAIGDLLGQVVAPTVLNNELSTTLNAILLDTGWQYGDLPNNLIKEIVINDYSTCLMALHEIMKVYELEMSYRVEFNGTEVKNRYIDVVKQRGNITNKVFEYGINLTKIERTEDTSELVTALIGVGKDNLTFEDYSAGLPEGYTQYENYLANNIAFQRFNKRGKHIFGVFKDDSNNKVELYKNTLKKLKELSEPKLTYACNIVTFKDVVGYGPNDSVAIGDTVTIKDFNYEPSLVLQARVMQMKTSKTNPQTNSIVLGNYKPLDITPSGTLQAIQSKLNQVASDMSNKEDTLYKQETQPPHVEGRMWLDTSVVPNQLKRSDGFKWIKSSLSLDEIQNISKFSRNILNNSALTKNRGLFIPIGTTEISNLTSQYTKVISNNSIGEKGIKIEEFPLQKTDYNVSFDVRGLNGLTKVKVGMFDKEHIVDITSEFERVYIPFSIEDIAIINNDFYIKFPNNYVNGQGFDIRKVSVSKSVTPHDWLPSEADEQDVIENIEQEIVESEQNIKDYVQSRGENLITNGTGLLENNTNFSGFIFDGSDSDNVSGSFKVSLPYDNILTTDEFTPISPTSEYIFKYSIKSPSFNTDALYYGLVNCYDTDNLLIKPEHTMYIPNTLTKLARDIQDGDTKIYLNDISGFQKTIADYNRRIILWGYKNSMGAKYDAETYSRNVTDAYLWLNDESFNIVEKSITLTEAWSYGYYPTGTELSQGNSGNAYKYIAGSGEDHTNDWVKVNGIIGGIDLTGNNVFDRFHPGTSKIQIGWLLTRGTGIIDTEIWLSNISFNVNLEDKIKTIDARVKSAELKISDEGIIATVENSTLLKNKADIEELEKLKKTSSNTLDNSSLKNDLGDMTKIGATEATNLEDSYMRIKATTTTGTTGIIKTGFPIDHGPQTVSFDVRGINGVTKLKVRLGEIIGTVNISSSFNRVYFTADVGSENPALYQLLIALNDGYTVGQGFDIKHISVTKGISRHDWTPSINDIDNLLNTKVNSTDFIGTINNVSTNFMTQLEQRADIIKSAAVAEAIDADNKLKKEFESNLTQTSQNLRIDIATTKSDIEALDGVVAKTNSFFDFSGDNLTIGKDKSPLTVTISNEEMSFNQNNTQIAYINGRKMYIKDLQVLEELIIGVHKIEKHDNDTTLIKWVGGNN